MNIYVYADWGEIGKPMFVGTLLVSIVRGKESFSFAYDDQWLASSYLKALDPDLGFFSGAQYSQAGNFGVFLDSCPDRWGRLLMKRRENILARNATPVRKPKTLFESDFLLGVHDTLRQGGLRFKTDKSGDFLDNDTETAAPPMTTLPELAAIAFNIDSDMDVDDSTLLKWLKMLISPGASLGGARPKACIQSGNDLYIAKFPSREDRVDVGAWEYVTYKLALNSGIQMALSRIQKFSGDYHTFITKRFDRAEDASRIHFASAMTQLSKRDGDESSSYLELAEYIQKSGSKSTSQQLEQLWRRIVFSIAVSNVDDHLRNHGFLLTEGGWQLSPAYDINPVPDGNHLVLAIDDEDGTLSFDLALSVVDFFQLNKKRGLEIINEVITAVKGWESIAKKVGIASSERRTMAPAFRVE